VNRSLACTTHISGRRVWPTRGTSTAALQQPPRKITKVGYDPELVWGLDTDRIVEGRTWWWWWWIFFIRDPKHPTRTRQLMILHSTKNADKVRVLDHTWTRAYRLKRERQHLGGGGGTPVDLLSFHGMSAAWYYDGEKMHDPWLLKDLEFESHSVDGRGSLTVKGRDDLYMTGDGTRYSVGAADDSGGTRIRFDMEPWNAWLSEHRYAKSNLWRHWGYDIMKVHAMKMRGTIEAPGGAAENIEGTAYFQKVRVNAPSTPWYWVVMHAENGLYLDYFQPNVGAQMWRRTERQRSVFDRWSFAELKLRNNLEVYDPGTGVLHTIKKFKLRHGYEKGSKLPIFRAEGTGPTARVALTLKTYSRAYWRFEQKHLRGLVRSILYYNEYPAELLDFEFEDMATKRKLTRADLGFVAANCEQTWGKLY